MMPSTIRQTAERKIASSRRMIEGITSELDVAETMLADSEKVQYEDSRIALETEALAIAQRQEGRIL